ncbi:glycosyl transferase [Floricoccus tropicus]|uniref:Glycosyl transferase n=2 Tax=Floricoccus tropicus TaxID=1859473 RepID=A0A1E8GKH5_9LACT|nr:glycosyl transferase [Floricoccus tropicus]
MIFQDKVSILMPLYNSEKFLVDTVNSVLNQTYDNFELLIVDDLSTDNSFEIAKNLKKVDDRVKVFQLEKNSGAAKARNFALSKSSGRFISYLDADDLWKNNKLELQTKIMIDNNYPFTCTSYDVINENGELLNKKITMLPRVDYKGFLTNNLLQTVGIMVDLDIVPKNLLMMPDLRRRQDAATWLQILRNGYDCYGVDESLAYYRRVSNSLSSNKIKAVKGVWYLYREVEKLPFLFSAYIFCRYALLAIWKRIYISRGKNE